VERQDFKSEQDLFSFALLLFFDTVSVEDLENQRKKIGQRSLFKRALFRRKPHTVQDPSNELYSR